MKTCFNRVPSETWKLLRISFYALGTLELLSIRLKHLQKKKLQLYLSVLLSSSSRAKQAVVSWADHPVGILSCPSWQNLPPCPAPNRFDPPAICSALGFVKNCVLNTNIIACVYKKTVVKLLIIKMLFVLCLFLLVSISFGIKIDVDVFRAST